MSVKFEISFAKSVSLSGGIAIVLKDKKGEVPAGAAIVDPAGILSKASGIVRFTGKALSVLDVVAPQGSPAERIFVIGTGKASEIEAHDWLKFGGSAAARIKNVENVSIFIDMPEVAVSAKAAADFALGMLMRAYSFDTYKTKKNEDEPSSKAPVKVTIVTENAAGAKKLFSDIRSDCLGRQSRPRTGQRAAERAWTGRVRRESQRARKARRRGRDPHRARHAQARHGRAARRRAGLRAAAAPGRHAVEGRQGQGQAGRFRRQGRRLRHRRHLHQARAPAWKT